MRQGPGHKASALTWNVDIFGELLSVQSNHDGFEETGGGFGADCIGACGLAFTTLFTLQ